MGLTAVLPTGETVHTGVKTAKGVAGYDLTRLLVGSEGTLGIITRLILRLIPLPAAIRTMTAVFTHMETAAETVSEIIRQGIVPRCVEYMDNASIRCAEAYLSAGLPVDAGAILILEVDGGVAEVDDAAARLVDLCRKKGADSVQMARSEAERANLWKARKAISPALYQIAPDKINEDIVVPKNKIPAMVRRIEELGKESGLTIASFGHAGDGNIHVNIMLDKKDEAQQKLAEVTVQALFDHTIELGGTLSGEHGIGITKAPYLDKEIGQVEMSLMRRIKAVFDPNGILNPGKIFPAS
jgi:glycolate oxidase